MMPSNAGRNYNHVFLDLETTGLSYPDILQIGAVSDCGKSFNGYAIPSKPIHPRATLVHGMFMTEEGQLRLGGGPVPGPYPSSKDLLIAFLTWLQSRVRKPIVLFGYNGNKFDFKILRDHMNRWNLTFGESVCGFLDPLAIARRHKIRPASGRMGIADMMNEFGVVSAGRAHDALVDAKNLKDLVYQMSIAYPNIFN